MCHIVPKYMQCRLKTTIQDRNNVKHSHSIGYLKTGWANWTSVRTSNLGLYTSMERLLNTNDTATSQKICIFSNTAVRTSNLEMHLSKTYTKTDITKNLFQLLGWHISTDHFLRTDTTTLTHWQAGQPASLDTQQYTDSYKNVTLSCSITLGARIVQSV